MYVCGGARCGGARCGGLRCGGMRCGAVRWRMIIYPHPPFLTQSQVFLNTLSITKVDVAYSMSQTPEEEANDKARERARVAADIKKSAAEKAKLQKKVVF